MSESENQKTTEHIPLREHVDRCLSMVMHYEEVQLIAEVIKEIIGEQEDAKPPDVES